MITYEDRLKFAETWDSSKDPIIEDGKTLPELFEGDNFGLAIMWCNRMQGISDRDTWEDALLS